MIRVGSKKSQTNRSNDIRGSTRQLQLVDCCGSLVWTSLAEIFARVTASEISRLCVDSAYRGVQSWKEGLSSSMFWQTARIQFLRTSLVIEVSAGTLITDNGTPPCLHECGCQYLDSINTHRDSIPKAPSTVSRITMSDNWKGIAIERIDWLIVSQETGNTKRVLNLI